MYTTKNLELTVEELQAMNIEAWLEHYATIVNDRLRNTQSISSCARLRQFMPTCMNEAFVSAFEDALLMSPLDTPFIAVRAFAKSTQPFIELYALCLFARDAGVGPDLLTPHQLCGSGVGNVMRCLLTLNANQTS